MIPRGIAGPQFPLHPSNSQEVSNSQTDDVKKFSPINRALWLGASENISILFHHFWRCGCFQIYVKLSIYFCLSSTMILTVWGHSIRFPDAVSLPWRTNQLSKKVCVYHKLNMPPSLYWDNCCARSQHIFIPVFCLVFRKVWENVWKANNFTESLLG